MPSTATTGDSLLPLLAALRCRVTILTDGTICHVLFGDGARALQLAVTGAFAGDRIRLLTDAVLTGRHLEERLRTLRRLADLCENLCLRPALYPPEPRGRRLVWVLRALDGWLAQAPQREIALALVGAARVEQDWRDPRGHLRDQIRRAIHRGRALMDGGYYRFLL